MNRFTFPSDSDKIYFYKSSQISYTVSRLSLQPVQLPHRQKQKMRIKMNKIFKNIDKLLETDLAKNSIKVIDNSGYTIGKLEPVAIESCMTPGTFRITPVSIKNENESIIFNNGRDKLKILVKDFEDGTVIVQTDEFIPQTTKAKSQCTSCTNCGRCSW